MLSSGQGSGCRMYDASGQGRYRNQLGQPLHKAIDRFEKGIFIGQVYILMGVGFRMNCNARWFQHRVTDAHAVGCVRAWAHAW